MLHSRRRVETLKPGQGTILDPPSSRWQWLGDALSLKKSKRHFSCVWRSRNAKQDSNNRCDPVNLRPVGRSDRHPEGTPSLGVFRVPNMKWNVIWQVNPSDPLSCIERDWFHEITSLVPIRSVQVDYETKPLLRAALPCSIICASCPNQTDSPDLIKYLRHVPRPRVLYHMSDEFVKIGKEVYQHCDLVIRNGSANFEVLRDPQFVQIPLGYVNGLGNSSRAFVKASHRKCSFAFLGTIKHERGN